MLPALENSNLLLTIQSGVVVLVAVAVAVDVRVQDVVGAGGGASVGAGVIAGVGAGTSPQGAPCAIPRVGVFKGLTGKAVQVPRSITVRCSIGCVIFDADGWWWCRWSWLLEYTTGG
ncbi:unnamed protein product [Prorocentrum cordatum]|uniref:Secreted protein n=1 Tax=Prorocentrum cordatum TaxID=2364126 RepID=A0ABN9PH53_9DINO|nr:unnamed protein product [Polarella glacialis]